ncbi:unnamed protein product [Adineta ricciae]|uniref:G-protein coupled receptors family 1 profile domain-containing protein n=1 Tax=Adineta ricciae TaxID=249248 RepID=A0A815AQ63_ADIRI|nr:unnamed protein product [Adineta ricciae]CAF1451661.1 unnamed protein product [Adineta ricciae]
MSASSLVIKIQQFQRIFNLYASNTIFVLGIFGNIVNILVFTRLKLFRGNRCAFYLTVESIVNIYLICLVEVLILVSDIAQINLANTSVIWCKLQTTLGQPARLFIGSIICFEALDQYLSTHYRLHLRQLSTFALAQISIIAVSFVWILQSIPYIIFYDIVPSFGCIITNQSLVYYYSYVYYIFLNGLLPICTASVFSLLAYRNVRHIIRRQLAIERRRLDRQMTAMIFARVIMFVVLSLPYTIFRIYLLNLNGLVIGTIHNAINQLVTVLVNALLSCNFSLSFYVFVTISSRFRRQVRQLLLRQCWRSMKRCLHLDLNSVRPIGVISDTSDWQSQ